MAAAVGRPLASFQGNSGVYTHIGVKGNTLAGTVGPVIDYIVGQTLLKARAVEVDATVRNPLPRPNTRLGTHHWRLKHVPLKYSRQVVLHQVYGAPQLFSVSARRMRLTWRHVMYVQGVLLVGVKPHIPRYRDRK